MWYGILLQKLIRSSNVLFIFRSSDFFKYEDSFMRKQNVKRNWKFIWIPKNEFIWNKKGLIITNYLLDKIFFTNSLVIFRLYMVAVVAGITGKCRGKKFGQGKIINGSGRAGKNQVFFSRNKVDIIIMQDTFFWDPWYGFFFRPLLYRKVLKFESNQTFSSECTDEG